MNVLDKIIALVEKAEAGVRRLQRWLTKRDLYVVSIRRLDGTPVAGLNAQGDIAICDCALFGGVEDEGLFFYKSHAEAFAQWRQHSAEYGRGYLYVVRPADDVEIDGYFNALKGES